MLWPSSKPSTECKHLIAYVRFLHRTTTVVSVLPSPSSLLFQLSRSLLYLLLRIFPCCCYTSPIFLRCHVYTAIYTHTKIPITDTATFSSSIPNVSRAVRVEFARGDGRVKRKEDERRQSIAPCDTLFVVNFNEGNTNEHDLRMLFEPYGELLRIDMRHNYAFVQFQTVEQATKAKESTNGGKLENNIITVEFVARQRQRDYQGPPRGPPPNRPYDRRYGGRDHYPPDRRYDDRGRYEDRGRFEDRGRHDDRGRYRERSRSRSPPRRGRFEDYGDYPPRRGGSPPRRGPSPPPRSRRSPPRGRGHSPPRGRGLSPPPPRRGPSPPEPRYYRGGDRDRGYRG